MTLTAGDLRNLVDRIIEIDSYKSKMGNDSDIVVVCFTVAENQAAKDLVNFVEKGYNFVLDADHTTGEQQDGMYRVYIELERNRHVPEQIIELIDGISKLTARKDYKFRYYKNFKSFPITLETLTNQIPVDADAYKLSVNESNMSNFKNFFNKSYLDSITLNEDQELIVKKAYADPIGFIVKDFGPSSKMLNSITENINMNDFAEIIFLTKYIGDYNVTKFGKKLLTFENQGHMLIVERI
jgi:hypothetical protein